MNLELAATFFVALTLLSGSQGGFTKKQLDDAIKITVSKKTVIGNFFPFVIPTRDEHNGFYVSVYNLNFVLSIKGVLGAEQSYEVSILNKGGVPEVFELCREEMQYLLLSCDKVPGSGDTVEVKVANGPADFIIVFGYPVEGKHDLDADGQNSFVVLIEKDEKVANFNWTSTTLVTAGDDSYNYTVFYAGPAASKPTDKSTPLLEMASLYLFTQAKKKAEDVAV